MTKFSFSKINLKQGYGKIGSFYSLIKSLKPKLL